MENGVLLQQYCEEVLGLHMVPAASTQTVAMKPVAVSCEELTDPTRALLNKVMASIGIKSWANEGPAHHVFQFAGLAALRAREERDGSVYWHLPTLSEMLGEGPEVAARKKSAWALLQQAQREIAKQ